uniref:DNA-directed DNA/RNA polymerase mu n=1 Tax=Oryzias sinensis TaxID=183150 RepID=A0A8C7YS74_9TELE
MLRWPHPKKRLRPEETTLSRSKKAVFEDVHIFLVERKMGRSRRSFLTQLARSKGFVVEDVLSDAVTHVVSEDSEASSLWAWLKGHSPSDPSKMHVLDISWFTDSMKERRPVAVETKHLIQDVLPEVSTPPSVVAVSQYACQRRTTTENHNKTLTVRNCSSNLAGNPAVPPEAAALTSLFTNLPNQFYLSLLMCSVCLCVLQEILQYGRSFEVAKILSDERFQTLKVFTSVFGVGLKTAEKWYRRGLRTFPDVMAEPSIRLNRMQQSGFLHYGDISRHVSKAEAQALGNIIDEAVHAIAPNGILTLTGGFRRGKEFGHDVDFIVTTPEQGQEEGLLTNIIKHLKHQGILLFCDYQPSSFDLSKLPSHRFEAMDHFAKCFLILKLEGHEVEGGLCRAEGDSRDWRAVRVDLVSPPLDRFAFTLLGWTGSRQFERDLRRFARLERRMLLDNHALFDKTKNEFLAATTEKDIFAHLGLEYIEPWQRNA